LEQNILKLGTLYIDEYGIARLYNPETNKDTNIIDSINATDTTLSNWTAVDGKSMNGEKVYGNSIGWSQLSSNSIFKWLYGYNGTKYSEGLMEITLTNYNAVLIEFGSSNNRTDPVTAICRVGSSGQVFGKMIHDKVGFNRYPVAYRTFAVRTDGIYLYNAYWHGFGTGATWDTGDQQN
jgi:hypothetical protein